MKSLISIILLALMLSTSVFAFNIDSLLQSKIPIENPYLVVNITSADCINCRLGSIKVLQQLKKAALSDRIVLLSDTKKRNE